MQYDNSISTIRNILGDRLLYAFASTYDENTILAVTATPVDPDTERLLRTESDTLTIQCVYVEDLRMSLDGYGFVSHGETLSETSAGQRYETVFSGYRKKLIEVAWPEQMVTGDEKLFQSHVEYARATLSRLTLYTMTSDKFLEDEFVDALILLSELPTLHKHIIKNECAGILRSIVSLNYLTVDNADYTIVDRATLLPYAVKEYSQYLLETEYLGAHESQASWDDFMAMITATSLPTYQTERPLVYKNPTELLQMTASDVPVIGSSSIQALLTEMMEIVDTHSINQSTTNFTAFPESGNSKAAVAAAMLVPVWNQNLISVDKSGPVGTFIEIQVIEWLRSLIGYDCAPVVSALNMGGVTGTGGVMSNTAGLLVARSRAFPHSRQHGLTTESRTPFLLIADKTLEHYSHKAAFWWLGLGEDNVIPVKSQGYDFDIEDLELKIKTYNSGGNVVVAVACLAGDSRTMTIQNIKEIHAVTSKHKIWLHVDACQGGIALFASNRDDLCGDYKLADSISIDPHKGLGIPYSSSFCLFKDQNALQSIAKSTDITIAKGSYDIGQITPFLGSRPFDALKFWALMKYHGLNGLAKNVDSRIQLTKDWADSINASKSFVALHDPKLTALSFSVDPRKLDVRAMSGDELSVLNKQIHDLCYTEGWLVIHCYDLIDYENRLALHDMKPIRVLGTNFGNVLLDKNHFPKFISYLESKLEAILPKLV